MARKIGEPCHGDVAPRNITVVSRFWLCFRASRRRNGKGVIEEHSRHCSVMKDCWRDNTNPSVVQVLIQVWGKLMMTFEHQLSTRRSPGGVVGSEEARVTSWGRESSRHGALPLARASSGNDNLVAGWMIVSWELNCVGQGQGTIEIAGTGQVRVGGWVWARRQSRQLRARDEIGRPIIDSGLRDGCLSTGPELSGGAPTLVC
jgi:hypothetical protein